jgi:transposase
MPIKVVSRDRGADYATAATQGAPQAVQVADRWHLIHNLSEALALVLESYRAQLRNASEALAPPSLKKAEPLVSSQEEALSPEESAPLVASGFPYRTPVIQHLQQDRRERRLARYEQMVALQQLGMTTASLAQQTGLSERSVRRWLAEGTFPPPRQRRRRPGLVDPYEAYILQRWQQGCRNGLQIWRELVAEAIFRLVARITELSRPASRSGPPSSKDANKNTEERSIWFEILSPFPDETRDWFAPAPFYRINP